MEELKENLLKLLSEIEKIAKAAGRKKDEIEIVAACKGVPVFKIERAIELGIKIIGENRVQEAEKKRREIKKELEWHMIGHLQKNKVKKAIEIFSMIQSVDSIELAMEINKRAEEKRKKIPCLIEVNTSCEKTKYGFKVNELKRLFPSLLSLYNLEIKGLFTIGPYPVDPFKTRESFKTLRILKEDLEKEYRVNLPHLSMGMSEDYTYAVLEGATMVRIGRLLFGEREQKYNH